MLYTYNPSQGANMYQYSYDYNMMDDHHHDDDDSFDIIFGITAGALVLLIFCLYCCYYVYYSGRVNENRWKATQLELQRRSAFNQQQQYPTVIPTYPNYERNPVCIEDNV